jgi:hypothetical protein
MLRRVRTPGQDWVMGAWGTGPYENDNAADIIAALGAGEFDYAEWAWVEDDEEYMEVGYGDAAIALGALLQAARGTRPPPRPGLDLKPVLDQITPERAKRISEQILRAIEDTENSEARHLWEDAGAFDEWAAQARSCIPEPHDAAA